MCTQKPPYDYSEQLYQRYKDAFNNYINDMVRRREREREAEVDVHGVGLRVFASPPTVPTCVHVLQLRPYVLCCLPHVALKLSHQHHEAGKQQPQGSGQPAKYLLL